MRTLLSLAFGAFASVLAYLVLEQIAKRFFSAKYRAQTAAAAVVIAFALGISWPRGGLHFGAKPQESAAAVPPSAVVAQAVDVGAACASAHLTALAGKGNVDTARIQGTIVAPATKNVQLRDGEMLTVQGWAAAPDLKGPVASTCVALDGKIITGVKVVYGAGRPDVSAAYQDAALMNTGYEASVSAAQVQPGRHLFQIAAVMPDGSAAMLPGGLSIVVGNRKPRRH